MRLLKNAAARRYFANTRAALKCGKLEKLWLGWDLWRAIRIFLDDEPEAADDDFVRAFGAPDYMAREMVLCERQTQGARRRRSQRRCAGAMMTAAVCAACIASVQTLQTVPVKSMNREAAIDVVFTDARLNALCCAMQIDAQGELHDMSFSMDGYFDAKSK